MPQTHMPNPRVYTKDTRGVSASHLQRFAWVHTSAHTLGALSHLTPRISCSWGMLAKIMCPVNYLCPRHNPKISLREIEKETHGKRSWWTNRNYVAQCFSGKGLLKPRGQQPAIEIPSWKQARGTEVIQKKGQPAWDVKGGDGWLLSPCLPSERGRLSPNWKIHTAGRWELCPLFLSAGEGLIGSLLTIRVLLLLFWKVLIWGKISSLGSPCPFMICQTPPQQGTQSTAKADWDSKRKQI